MPAFYCRHIAIFSSFSENGITSCCFLRYQLPAVSKKGSAMQTVSDLITTLCEAFDLLGAAANSDLVLELDGFTVISNSPLSLFRDGDTVIIRSKQKWQTATVPVTNGRQVEGGKRKRSEVALALTAAEDQQAEMSRPRKRKKSSVSVTETAQAAVEAAGTGDALSEQEAVPVSTHGQAVQAAEAPATASQKRRTQKRKKNQTQIHEADAAVELSQPANGDASLPAGDAVGTTVSAPGTSRDAPGTSGDALQSAADAPAKEKKQSRSARRKQLKRRYRRLGVAPPQDPTSSSQPPASVNPALAAAAEASPFDPNGAQPHQGTLEPHLTQDSPPAKRLKTQLPDAAQTAKTQLRAQPATAAPGHVHFADSDNESAAQSDDDNGNESLPPAPTQANDGPATVQQQPSDPQSSSQGQNSHKRKPAGVMGSGSGAVPSGPAKPGPASDMDRAGPSVALPESDAECAALPAVHAYPMPGDIVAYKLLEIGANWAPEVSEWRHGEVGAADLAGTVVIMPLAGQGSQTVPFAEANGHAVEEEDGEEEEEEGPPSNYDEDGILTTELPAFAELRLIKASPNPTNLPAGPPAAPTAPPAGTAAQLQSFQDGLLDTGTAAAVVVAASSQSGNTATPDLGNTVPKIGVWADFSDVLARRKAELASESNRADLGKKGADSMDSRKQQQQQQQQEKLGIESVNAVPGINTPGAVRPRGGVRASAMGPMLAHLRSSGAFENTV
ncbi:TPA: hypothetical protein ACH3X2_006300 [Trebouxia sp. C0005]